MSLTPAHINLDKKYCALQLDTYVEIKWHYFFSTDLHNVHVIHISTVFSRIVYM